MKYAGGMKCSLLRTLSLSAREKKDVSDLMLSWSVNGVRDEFGPADILYVLKHYKHVVDGQVLVFCLRKEWGMRMVSRVAKGDYRLTDIFYTREPLADIFLHGGATVKSGCACLLTNVIVKEGWMKELDGKFIAEDEEDIDALKVAGYDVVTLGALLGHEHAQVHMEVEENGSEENN